MSTPEPKSETRVGSGLGRALTLAALLGFGIVLRNALDLLPGNASTATISLGFLLLAAVVGGRLSAGFGLPKITGYILIGLLVGPEVLGLVSEDDVAELKLIDDIAISLIALSAGGELRISELKTRGRSISGIMVAEMLTVFVVIAGGTLLVSDFLPITQGRAFSTVLVIALVFGSIAIANSPSVAIAVINDTGSRGPVASTILGVTVLKDVAVILLFAVALAIARTALSPGSEFETDFFIGLGVEIGGSIVAGVVSGIIISLLLRTVRAHVVVFALAIAFVNAYVAQLLHLEVLLLSLVAGFFLENISPVHGDPFVHALERNSLPVYALFFALAGAGLHLAELAELWPFVAAFVIARAGAVFVGTWVGARVTGSEPEVRRYAWLGFISQAGVTLGMVVIAARSFPEWGAELQTLFVAMVAIHELIGPVLLQKGLERAGEVGQRSSRSNQPATGSDRSPEEAVLES
ncbi:MAG TPA: cation:proton antiporter [Longimicrobiales bacterium]|nr:cation:proton antiporter [Longimicrobiales bacterium]